MGTPFTGTNYSNGPILPPWYVPGWTAQDQLTANQPNSLTPFLFSGLPADQAMLLITQQCFDGDGNPLGGFFTFMPSSAVTITESGKSYRVPQRLGGTETFAGQDAGVSPWAWSLEGSGRIFIWRGQLTVKLLCSDNPNLATDDGLPLTYHVEEHFAGGRQYDISAPSTAPTLPDGTVDLSSLIIAGSVSSLQFDYRDPFGNTGLPDVWPKDIIPDVSVQEITAESTEYVTVNVGAVFTGTDIAIDDIESDQAYFAFMEGVAQPQDSDWLTASWVAGPPYLAQILIGPENNGHVLAKGQYMIWFKLVDNPEVPVVQVGSLYIT